VVTGMFEKLKNRKKKKKKQRPEKFQSLTANGVAVEAINFAICKNPDDTARLEVRTKDVAEALHYDHVDFELKTNLKKINVGAKFKEAISEKHFKLYIFQIESYEQFFI
jgi:hypothetical protein